MKKYFRIVPFAAFLALTLVYSCKKEPGGSNVFRPATDTVRGNPVPSSLVIDSYAGTYHVAGSWYGVGLVSGSGNFDDTIVISKYNNSTLVLTGNQSIFHFSGSPMFNAVNTFWVGGGDNWEQIVFRTPYNDSIFFTSQFGYASGYTAYQCEGKKIF